MDDKLRKALIDQEQSWRAEARAMRRKAADLILTADQLDTCRIQLSVKLEENPPASHKE
jgi:uncharacterized membrane protein